MPQSIQLGVSFDFPPFLTVGQYARYQAEAGGALKAIQDNPDVSPTAAYAIIFVAAANAKLLRNWHSYYMPTLDYKTVDEVHAFTVLWAAEKIHDWIESQRRVDPKASWRRLIAWIATVSRLQSWRWRGVAIGSAVYRAAVDWLIRVRESLPA